MSRIAEANNVGAGHGSPNDTVNKPTSVSVSLVKTDITDDMDQLVTLLRSTRRTYP